MPVHLSLRAVVVSLILRTAGCSPCVMCCTESQELVRHSTCIVLKIGLSGLVKLLDTSASLYWEWCNTWCGWASSLIIMFTGYIITRLRLCFWDFSFNHVFYDLSSTVLGDTWESRTMVESSNNNVHPPCWWLWAMRVKLDLVLNIKLGNSATNSGSTTWLPFYHHHLAHSLVCIDYNICAVYIEAFHLHSSENKIMSVRKCNPYNLLVIMPYFVMLSKLM